MTLAIDTALAPPDGAVRVTWALGTLLAGAPARQLSLQLRLRAYGEIVNDAEIVANGVPPLGTSATVRALSPAEVPALSPGMLFALGLLMSLLGLVAIGRRGL